MLFLHFFGFELSELSYSVTKALFEAALKRCFWLNCFLLYQQIGQAAIAGLLFWNEFFEIRLECKVIHVLKPIYSINKVNRDAWKLQVALDQDLSDILEDEIEVSVD